MKISFKILPLIFAVCANFAFAQTTGGVKGKVRAANEKTIAGATITARLDGKEIKSVKSDSGGNFQMTGLAPGTYNFAFDKEGYATGVKYDVAIVENKVRDLGDRLILSVDPGNLVFIKGSVFTGEGRSFAGAQIKIERVEADGKTKKVGSATSNYVGEFAFRFSGGAAKYRVTASAKNLTDTKEIDVTNAAVYRLALTLNPAKDK